MVAETPASILTRRAARAMSEATYITTLNVAQMVSIDFVWYPGAQTAATSLIDPFVSLNPSTGRPRDIVYTWQRDGGPLVRRVMNGGRIFVDLPLGRKGVLTVFDTSWELSRSAIGVNMSAANTLTGVQQRLNRLGYHLRRPGNTTPGIDGNWGRLSEIAVVQFQVDYTPSGGAPAAAANKLPVRGEWTANTNAAYTNNLFYYLYSAWPPAVANPAQPAPANPTATDAANLAASLQAQVGA